MRAELLVAVRAREEQRPARRLAREVVKELRARVVGPLDIVDHDDELLSDREGFEQLHDGAEEPRLAGFGKVCGEARDRDALGHRRHERRDLRERNRGELLQRFLRRHVERLADEIDHRLVRHGALDLVAVGGQRTKAARARVVAELPHQPALADARLTFDQHEMARACREPREQADQQPVLVAAADERRAPSLLCRHGGVVNVHTLGRAHRPGGLEKGIALLGGDRELFGQALGEAARRPSLVRLDLADGKARAAHGAGELLLGKVERLAAPPQPVAERARALFHAANSRALVPLFVPLRYTARAPGCDPMVPSYQPPEQTMKRLATAAAVALFATASWAQHQHHKAVKAADLKWSAVPSLPKGAQISVIEGPMNQAVPFTVRLKFPGNYPIPPHTHPAVERVTVLSGVFHMGMGQRFDRRAPIRCAPATS